MQIKLISPRVTKRPMDSDWKTRMSPPLSLLVLGALTPTQHDVVIADENIERVSLKDTPDLVGITVKVDTDRRAREIASSYRRQGIPVVVGGIHPTVCPDDCLTYADAVVIGEAERLWEQVIADAAAGTLSRTYRNDTPVDINRTPVPRWELLNQGKYLFTNTLTLGRGCPWRCDFCYNSSLNVDARYRMKPVENILQEIAALGVPHLMFIDDNFIGDKQRCHAFLLRLKNRGVTWHAAVSADIGREDDLLDLMAESGCHSLFIGFETMNQKNLMSCRKAQNRTESYDETIRKIHDRGIMVNASVVFGFDHDDVTVFPATLDWLVRNRVATMTAHILTPYPGTALYRNLLADGRIIDTNLDHYNTAYAVFRPKHMSPDELEKGYLSMYSHFYSWTNILQRMPADRRQRVAYLEFNLLYRKFGKATCNLGKLFGMRNLAKLAKAAAYPERWALRLRDFLPNLSARTKKAVQS